MNDLEFIVNNSQLFEQIMQSRAVRFDSTVLIELYKQRKLILTSLNELQSTKNNLSAQFSRKDIDRDEITRKSKEIDIEISKIKEKTDDIQTQIKEILLGLPNILSIDVPVGADESANVCIRKIGEVKQFSFQPKSHDELSGALGILDFNRTAKMCGARFSTAIGVGAKLLRILKGFCIEHNIQHGYQEYFTPYLVKEEAMYRAGQLPKFSEESFVVDSEMRLIPTSEVSLVNFFADTFLSTEELPIRMTAYSECFRSEAGSSGKDTKGIIRQHQFGKVELVSIVHPDNSSEELERMVGIVESLLQKLAIPYRVMLLCSGDTGFCSSKTYDVEVWIPSQNCYREISSCSNCGEFQSRRLSLKYKENKQKGLLHTLNGSSIAIGRLLVAILENYQREDGSIDIPEAIKKEMGLSVISNSN